MSYKPIFDEDVRGKTYRMYRNGCEYVVTNLACDFHSVTVNGVDYIGDCDVGNYVCRATSGGWGKAFPDVNYILHELFNGLHECDWLQDENGNWIFNDDGEIVGS